MKDLDLEGIRLNYESMTDSEIVRIATQDATGLRPEAVDILKIEIEKRKLDQKLIDSVAAQNRDLNLEELVTYAEALRNLPCPCCGSGSSKLNGTVSHTVKSFILFTTYKKETKIACPDCLDKLNENAIITTSLFGWWGVPWGVLKSPVYIYRNVRSKRENRSIMANRTLIAITAGRIGEIVAANGNKLKLQEILRSEKY